MIEELEAKIRRLPATYFISAHHVKAKLVRGQQSSTEETFLPPCSAVVTRNEDELALLFTLHLTAYIE